MTADREARHPPAPRLEAVAAGDDAGSIAEHLAACVGCTAYVARLRSEAEAFRALADPPTFAEAIRKRAAASTTSRSARAGRVIFYVVGPALAVAAAAVIWIRRAPSRADEDRFKGGVVVAAIRERDGHQERLIGPFAVRLADRIRVEIAVDHVEPITAGLLSDDGEWTVLEPPMALGAGTHYSQLAARIDDVPGDATLLVGAPVDVERARRSWNFGGLVAWRITDGRQNERDK